MRKKTLGVFVTLLMILAVVPAAFGLEPVTPQDTPKISLQNGPDLPAISPALKEKIQRDMEFGRKEFRFIVAPKDGYEMEVYNKLKKIGIVDPISRPEFKFIVVTVPADKVSELENVEGIYKVWLDRTVKVPKVMEVPEVGLEPKLVVEPPKSPDMFMSIFTINAYDTWMNYGIYGDNVTVAVLDTGIDVAHPFLQTDLYGNRKIVDIYDASDEGIVQLFNASAPVNGVITVNKNVTLYLGYYSDLYYGHESKYMNYTLTNYTVGAISGDYYYIGALPEKYFDMNFDGDKDDVYPILVVEDNGTYTAYLDMNMNNAFTDETPMGLFNESGDYAVFNESLVTVALARVHIGDMGNEENVFYVHYGEGDGYAMLMWDAHGHGTHVSGTVAGYGADDYVFGGVYGVAPNAKLIEVKVLPGEEGFGRTSWIINGMFYAALNGADVISMSLGGGGEINDGIENPENFYANIITDLFGVVFSIAAGNEGPSTNSVHSPGTSDLVITVGNYVGNEREAYWYGVDLGIMSGPSMSSSRGPRDDGMLDPDVMAPGTDIFSSLPMWYTVRDENPYSYYGIWSGTSMATPHVSGAVALMISYAKAHGLRYDPFMIKRALELSAKPTNQTLIDQGFGLIQVDKAIEKLEELSQEPTNYIFAGTTFTGFKNPIGKEMIPISPAYIDFNGYFQIRFGFPYLYRGVYIRNERSGVVPIYFYPLTYIDGFGLYYVLENKTYTISTNVDWIIPNTDKVTINGAEAVYVSDLEGKFAINIDYSKFTKSGTYVGLVYIDDPETSYIDGFVPVIVDFPVNPNGELSAKITDTEKPGQAKHYFFEVPRGTQMLEVTLRVPVDEEGTPMGRTKLVIARPLGGVVHDGVPGYYYVGPGGPTEYTWVVENPVEGVWEITAYTSISSLARTGYEDSHYEIEITAYSVTMEPSSIIKDVSSPGTVNVKATATNNFEEFNAQVVGYGVGRLDIANALTSSVGQDEWDVIGFIPVTSSDYFLRLGITEPEDPNADLDLYIYYYPTYEDMVNGTNEVIFVDQIGPTSDEVFEQFMPTPGYYLIAVYGYDTAGYDPIQYVFYYQILGDNGDVSVDSTPFTFEKGAVKYISASVNLEENGTYLGLLGIVDADTGTPLTYAPMTFQVGQPEMYVTLMGSPVIGEPSEMTLKILDLATMEPLTEPVTAVINGVTYYTDTGEIKFRYTPMKLGEQVFNVQVTSDTYKDFEGEFTVSVKEPFTEIYTGTSGKIVAGEGEITNFESYHGQISLTISGETGERATVMVTMPLDAYYIHITGAHVVDYYIERGTYAQYVFITVEFHSEAEVTITYKTSADIIRTMDVVWYTFYNRYAMKFNETYEQAVELGVDNETLNEALKHKEMAEDYYEQAWQFGHPLQGHIQAVPYLRKAYLHMKMALKILEEAIEALS